MAATGKTPILLYGSTTATNVPLAGNLTNSTDGCEIAINVADKNLFFKDSTNVVNTVPIRQSGTSSNGWLSSTDWNTFNGKASTSSPTFSGDVTVQTGNLVIGTSGKGIDFSATAGTGTSELLADYEEGTWTPNLTFGGGSTGLTYFDRIGTYTKVGNRVYVTGKVYINDKGSSTGSAVISGLPYTASGSSNYDFSPLYPIYVYTNNMITDLPQGRITGGATSIELFKNAAGANAAITQANFTTYVVVSFCAIYIAA